MAQPLRVLPTYVSKSAGVKLEDRLYAWRLHDLPQVPFDVAAVTAFVPAGGNNFLALDKGDRLTIVNIGACALSSFFTLITRMQTGVVGSP